ncbi:MAG: hypothetical protein KAI50_11685 [Desulfobacterales bacterium]|nr:hypothetical protein [Desulfobacterales bacterium]
MEAWMHQSLVKLPLARVLLGVFVPPKTKVTGENYHLYHDQKVIDLIEAAKKEGDDPEQLMNDLLPRGLQESDLPENPSSNDLLSLMKQQPEADPPVSFLTLFLRGQLPLPVLKRSLLMEDESPVSQKEFQNELKNLTFGEYLELTTSLMNS